MKGEGTRIEGWVHQAHAPHWKQYVWELPCPMGADAQVISPEFLITRYPIRQEWENKNITMTNSEPNDHNAMTIPICAW